MKILSFAIVVSLALCGRSEGEFVLDSDRDRACAVVVAADATAAERHAADRIVRYLSKMMPGVKFAQAGEGAAAAKRICVGPVADLRDFGFDVTAMGEEEELVAARKGTLYIAGGRPRGTLYAAADFLERCGVVCAAEDTIVTPEVKRISWDGKDLRRTPAFAYRYTATQAKVGEADMFNKYNCYRNGGADNGGYAAYGNPGDCHTFVHYSKKFPADDPSLFALTGQGKRAVPLKAGEKAPLCPTNPKVLELIWAQMKENVEAARRTSERTGIPCPKLYEISMDDELTPCLCPACRKVTEEEGCYAGVMLRLVNPLAERLERMDPALKVSMLVYQKTLDFPRKARPRANVLPRVCVHDREWIVNVKAEWVEPVTRPHNDEFRRTLEDWSGCTRQFGVWEYWEYYLKGIFPYVSLDTAFENLRYYRDRGCTNVLIEMEQLRTSFFALRNYLALKLMDDPDRTREDLLGTFLPAYYGAAAPAMREYLEYLDAEVRAEASREAMGPRLLSSCAYLNEGFFRKVYGMLGRAERAAAGDERSLRHVRFEYAAVDRALLVKFPKLIPALGLGKKALANRVRDVEHALVETLGWPHRRKEELAKTDDFVAGELVEAPLPAEVKGEEVHDYKFNSFYVDGRRTRLVEDPDAIGGKAVEIVDIDVKDRKFHTLPFTGGLYNGKATAKVGPSICLEEVPQDERYHLYRIGNWSLTNGAKVWLHWTWWFQFNPRDSYMATPDYPCDVFVSIKFTGPSYVKGSARPDGIFVDRVITAR